MAKSKLGIFIKEYFEYEVKMHYNFDLIQICKQMLVIMGSHALFNTFLPICAAIFTHTYLLKNVCLLTSRICLETKQ